MFTNSEFELIQKEFMEVQNTRGKKLRKIWGVLLLAVIGIILLFLFIFPNQFLSSDTAWILPTYGGIALVATIIGFLISLVLISEKPYFESVYPKIIQKINQIEDLYLEYEAYPKTGKEFNINGGLFTRFASVRTKRKIEGYTEEQHKYSIYDCTMTTSSGNNQQTHFDGTYFLLRKTTNTTLQVRSNGSPKFKGVKFTLQEGSSNLKVYKKTEESVNSIDHLFIRFMEQLAENPNHKRVYLSVTGEEIHLGLWFKKDPTRRQKTFNIDVLNNYAKYFLSEYELCNKIDSIDNY